MMAMISLHLFASFGQMAICERKTCVYFIALYIRVAFGGCKLCIECKHKKNLHARQNYVRETTYGSHKSFATHTQVSV